MKYSKKYKEELENPELYEPPINQRETIQKIIKIRKEKGITQKQIAEHLDVTRSYYNQIENFKRYLSKEYIIYIAELFGMEYRELVIYEADYSIGYYDCLDDYSPYLFNNMEYILFGLEKKIDMWYTSSLYLFLQELGYRITIKKVDQEYNNIINAKTYPYEFESNTENGFVGEETRIENNIIRKAFSSDLKSNNVFELTKDNETVCCWSIDDYFQFEKIIKSSIQGYIDNISRNYSRLFKSKINKIENEGAVSEAEENEASKNKDMKDEIEQIKTLIKEIENEEIVSVAEENENPNTKLKKYKIEQIKVLINKMEKSVSDCEESRTDKNK